MKTQSEKIRNLELRIVHAKWKDYDMAMSLKEAEGQFTDEGKNFNETYAGLNSAVYAFDNIEDLEFFQHILNGKGIPYSVHTSREYNSLIVRHIL